MFKQKLIKETEELKMYHVTCVMHNTRVSQRMIDYKVQKGEPEYLNTAEEFKLIEILVKIIRDDHLKILELNLCADHLHFVIVCEANRLTSIVGKMKSVSAKEFNIWRGITIPLTMGHAPLSNNSHAPLSNNSHAPLSINSQRGITQNSLWAQKFNRKEINSEKQLHNVLNYIHDNRIKHNLPMLSGKLQNMIQSIIASYEDAF